MGSPAVHGRGHCPAPTIYFRDHLFKLHHGAKQPPLGGFSLWWQNYPFVKCVLSSTQFREASKVKDAPDLYF